MWLCLFFAADDHLSSLLQVLLDTTQLYYYLYHKTPNMIYKRALMVLSASFEFERGHNSAVVVGLLCHMPVMFVIIMAS